MNDEYKELEADFMKFATERGMVGIKGENDFYFYLMNAKKIKLKRSIFGNLSVSIVFLNERKKIKLKFKTVKILVPELRQQNEKNINDLETFLKSKA